MLMRWMNSRPSRNQPAQLWCRPHNQQHKVATARSRFLSTRQENQTFHWEEDRRWPTGRRLCRRTEDNFWGKRNDLGRKGRLHHVSPGRASKGRKQEGKEQSRLSLRSHHSSIWRETVKLPTPWSFSMSESRTRTKHFEGTCTQWINYSSTPPKHTQRQSLILRRLCGTNLQTMWGTLFLERNWRNSSGNVSLHSWI